MSIVVLDSLDDPRLIPYRDLPGKQGRDDGARFVVEGRFLVERLLATPLTTESVLTDAARVATLPAGTEQRTTILVLPSGAIDQLVGFEFHRGLLACGLRPSSREVNELVPASPSPALLVICSRIADPTNLGGILRNCAAFGADAVLLGPGCADAYSRRVTRVSMGAIFRLLICKSTNLEADLCRLAAEHGLTLLATVANDGAERLADVAGASRVGLLFGNEGFGLSSELLRICQRQVTIPIRSDVDSLNVAVASGVLLYHFARRS